MTGPASCAIIAMEILIEEKDGRASTGLPETSLRRQMPGREPLSRSAKGGFWKIYGQAGF
jgi:hypothetical protein